MSTQEIIRKSAVLHCHHRVACPVRFDYYQGDNWRRCNCDFADDEGRRLKTLLLNVELEKRRGTTR